MAERVTHVIEVRAVGEHGETLKRDPHDPTTTDSPTAPKKNKGLEKSVSKTIALHMGQRAISYATSNYGNLTGDIYGQEQLNTGLQLAGMITTVAVGGWAGVAAVGLQIGKMAVDRVVDVSKSRNASANIQARRGMDIGGSR